MAEFGCRAVVAIADVQEDVRQVAEGGAKRLGLQLVDVFGGRLEDLKADPLEVGYLAERLQVNKADSGPMIASGEGVGEGTIEVGAVKLFFRDLFVIHAQLFIA